MIGRNRRNRNWMASGNDNRCLPWHSRYQVHRELHPTVRNRSRRDHVGSGGSIQPITHWRLHMSTRGRNGCRLGIWGHRCYNRTRSVRSLWQSSSMQLRQSKVFFLESLEPPVLIPGSLAGRVRRFETLATILPKHTMRVLVGAIGQIPVVSIESVATSLQETGMGFHIGQSWQLRFSCQKDRWK